MISLVNNIGIDIINFFKVKLIQNIDNIILNHQDSVGENLNTNENDHVKVKLTVWGAVKNLKKI